MVKFKSLVLLSLRCVIGWHLLYEGLNKLFTPGWSASDYLAGSYGFMSGIFHSLSENQALIRIVDLLNIWGLILIGTGLFLGILIRFSAIAGIVLLLLYYFAYPPFGASIYTISREGHYWIVNRNLIEAIALGVIFLFPASDYSLLNLFERYRKKMSSISEKGMETVGYAEKRREILKGLATLPFFGGVFYSAAADGSKAADVISGATTVMKTYDLKDLKGFPPKGKLGNMQISRIIGGCNQLGGYAHARDLHYVRSLFLQYNTPVKLFETFSLMDKAGIDTTNMIVSGYPVFNAFKKATGSKMQSISQAIVTEKDPLTEVKQSVDYGATTIYIQGGCGDALVRDGRFDLISEVLGYIRSQGMLAGMGAHSIQVPVLLEQKGIRPDYYFKTMHHDNYWSAHPRENRKEFEIIEGSIKDHNRYHDNMFDLFPEQTIEVFSKIDLPLFGFKIMAGGAIKPADAFRYAFENGADFICVGMFDFQIIEDVNLTIETLNSDLKRIRPWYS
jgi:uncharacterized membrane protein YphA (DoxX/SURF4 family)